MRIQSYSRIFQVTTTLVFIISAASCKVTQTAVSDPKDLSYIYNPLNNPFNPQYRVFNNSGSESTLYIKLFTREIFFSEANPTGDPLASLTYTVRLYDDTKGGVLADTARFIIELNKNKIGSEVVVPISLTADDGSDYTAEVRIVDNITRRMIQAFVKFDKAAPTSPNNFRVREHESNADIFSSVLSRGEYINLLYPRKSVDTMYVLFYKYFDQIPFAPFVMLPERTPPRDPERIIPIAVSDTLPIMFPGKGIYLFTLDSTIYEGITFFNFGDEYPGMTSPEAMTEPLSYIATADEMNIIRSSSKPKVALDEFWLARSTNIERSRELLRIYYNRVLFANHYFTSYREGWRTDRGMVYIIYGPPDKLYKNSEGERWGYKKSEIKSTWGTRYKIKEDYLWFEFRNKRSPFTRNDFYLNRSDATPTFWEQAVLSWRKGIVFRIDNPDDI
jgi:GWxTD domain-containing protein